MHLLFYIIESWFLACFSKQSKLFVLLSEKKYQIDDMFYKCVTYSNLTSYVKKKRGFSAIYERKLDTFLSGGICYNVILFHLFY